MLSHELIETILHTIPRKRIGLVGDLFVDRYLQIDPARDEPSIETGLTAYQVTGVRSQPGALGTVINNLVALGVGALYPVAIIGDDGEGFELRQALGHMPGVQQEGLILAADRRTPTYTKPMYGNKELNRLDIKNRTPTPANYETQVIAKLDENWHKCDAWLVLDQVSEANCGVVTDRVREHLRTLARQDPRKFVLADSRENIRKFQGICIKPNLTECLNALYEVPPKQFTDHDRAFAALEMARRVDGPVFCTQGEHGIRYVPRPVGNKELIATDIPGYPVSGPIDIVGAGDSSSAGIACGIVSGMSHEQAAAFGNLIASITVQQIGTTGTANPEQVRARWQQVSR